MINNMLIIQNYIKISPFQSPAIVLPGIFNNILQIFFFLLWLAENIVFHKHLKVDLVKFPILKSQWNGRCSLSSYLQSKKQCNLPESKCFFLIFKYMYIYIYIHIKICNFLVHKTLIFIVQPLKSKDEELLLGKADCMKYDK